jgi:peptidyl-prolyl cis-trans isomerase C
MIDQNYDQVTSNQIDRQLGKEFREQLASLPEGEWHGPIRSAFGWHAVFVENVTPGRLLPIEDVRGEIMRDLEYEERQAAKEQFFTELMQQYDIVYKGQINNLLDAE